MYASLHCKMVRALWEYGLYEQTDGAECMDTPLREHIPKERCFLSDKVQQGGGAARIIWHQLFPELAGGGRGKGKHCHSTCGAKNATTKGRFQKLLSGFCLLRGGGVSPLSAKPF